MNEYGKKFHGVKQKISGDWGSTWTFFYEMSEASPALYEELVHMGSQYAKINNVDEVPESLIGLKTLLKTAVLWPSCILPMGFSKSAGGFSLCSSKP